ncbi:MAG TPA: isoamylase early set domain-containing protein [Armatimonadota bacterium]|jgi:1,4-alpha-glucan branching enzyme|nr:isoamylase early set domain-containing protein [Armatimonadota bacterium]
MATTSKEASARKRVAFALHAPEARSVSLVGDFNNWDPEAWPLKRDEAGTWKTTRVLPTGKYQYLFYVDGHWTADPQCDQRTTNPFGSQNCVRIVADR